MLQSSVRINFICHVLMIHATGVEKVLLFEEKNNKGCICGHIFYLLPYTSFCCQSGEPVQLGFVKSEHARPDHPLEHCMRQVKRGQIFSSNKLSKTCLNFAASFSQMSLHSPNEMHWMPPGPSPFDPPKKFQNHTCLRQLKG